MTCRDAPLRGPFHDWYEIWRAEQAAEAARRHPHRLTAGRLHGPRRRARRPHRGGRHGELMMTEDPSPDPEVEFSPLCQFVTSEGITVRVVIFRVSELDSRWSLEVVDQSDASTVWDDLFDTDDEAFEAALEVVGIHRLSETFH